MTRVQKTAERVSGSPLATPCRKATDPVFVDLEHQTVTTQFQDRFSFEIDPFRKMCLLEGLDEISLTEKSDAAIGAYEARLDAEHPWMRPAA